MRYFTIILSLLISASLFSQKNISTSLKSRIHNNTLPGNTFDVLIDGDIEKLVAAEKTLGIKVKYHAGTIACVNLGVNALAPLIESKAAKYIELIENRKRPLNDTMRVRNRINPVKAGTTPLTAAYEGTNVIVGIIDTGIDFNHPDFKDAMGNTRISFIWDQTVNTPTNSPMPFNYGEEWTAAQINASVCTHNDLPYWGHGTHVSGIAAGNGLANGKHAGVASKANIIVVAVDFNKPAPIIADGVQYIVNKATAAGKPFVINASLGDYYGSHDATDTEAKMIEALISNIPGRALVAAAGNAGTVKFHTKNMVNATDTNFTWLRKPSGNVYYWLYADTANIKNVNYSVGANSPNFTDLGRIGFKNYNYGFTLKTDTLKNGTNRIGIVKSLASVNAYGVYELFLEIVPDSANYFWRIESNGTGVFDAWNFDFVSTGLPSATTYPKIVKYTMPDTVSSMVSGFQCSNQVITVGNYINLNSYYDVTNTLITNTDVTGQLASSSSCGPTRNNLIKPDVAASGAGIFSCLVLSMQANLITNAPTAVSQGSFHVAGGGTSASSPVVAGLAALFLEAFPASTNIQVKQAITNCTYKDGFTGTSLPNNKWGYGKLDGFSTFTCVVTAGLNENTSLENQGDVYPNPFNEKTLIKLKQEYNGTVKIFNSIGELVYEEKIKSDEYTVERRNLKAAGVYMVQFTEGGKNQNYKIIAID